MRYQYVITKRAAKEITKLDTAIQKRLKHKLEFFLTLKDPLVNAKTLTNSQYGDYRWRIGDYRVIFDVDKCKIIILQVQHRRDVYRR